MDRNEIHKFAMEEVDAQTKAAIRLVVESQGDELMTPIDKLMNTAKTGAPIGLSKHQALILGTLALHGLQAACMAADAQNRKGEPIH